MLDKRRPLWSAFFYTTITINKPESLNFIPGQSHFIKTVEDREGVAWRTGLLRQIGYKLGEGNYLAG